MSTTRGSLSPADELAVRQRKQTELQFFVERLKAIRALHVTAYHAQAPIEKLAVEFFYTIGDLLEGTAADKLPLKLINQEDFMREYEDG
jgi:hypothetical protein